MKRITIITFSVFMVEAIIHYNQGAKSNSLPPKNDLMRIAFTVFIFSLINASIIKQ